MDQSRRPLRLSEKDQEKLNCAILSDFLLLVERVTYCGMGFDLSGLIEQTFILRMSSSVKSPYRGKVMKDTLFTERNSINGLGCLNGNLNSFQTVTLYMQWETMLSKLFSEIQESPTGGDLLLTQSFRTEKKVVSFVPSTPPMLSVNLSLSRFFAWTVKNWILSIETSSENTPSKQRSTSHLRIV